MICTSLHINSPYDENKWGLVSVDEGGPGGYVNLKENEKKEKTKQKKIIFN
jgi:hypothetical protein